MWDSEGAIQRMNLQAASVQTPLNPFEPLIQKELPSSLKCATANRRRQASALCQGQKPACHSRSVIAHDSSAMMHSCSSRR